MKQKFDRLSAEFSKIATQRYSTSFSLGIRFLDKELHHPIYAIYGFVRFADEIVDSFHEYDKASLLAKFKKDCFEAIENGISLNPILNSFQQVVRQYHIDHQLIHLFLKSMEMDLEKQNFSPEKYQEYILGSAEVVGLMCLFVFTGGDINRYYELMPAAKKLGSAFQKINFLRDIGADFQNLNRTYFPNVDFSRYQTITGFVPAGCIPGLSILPSIVREDKAGKGMRHFLKAIQDIQYTKNGIALRCFYQT